MAEFLWARRREKKKQNRFLLTYAFKLNLGGLFRGRLCGGGGVKITPLPPPQNRPLKSPPRLMLKALLSNNWFYFGKIPPCPKLVGIVLET